MGIFKRFKDMMKANANKAMDNMEDPDAMLDQYVRNMQDDLASVTANTAKVMATAKGLERKIAVCKTDIDSLTSYAASASAAGNENDTRTFLDEKASKEAELADLTESLATANAYVQRMSDMRNELADNETKASNKCAVLKSRLRVADTKEIMNKTYESNCKVGKDYAEFTRLEDRINEKLDAADAYAEITKNSSTNSLEELKKKYSGTGVTAESNDTVASLSA